MKKIKCPQCLKLVSETDNCDGCDKSFCKECLIIWTRPGTTYQILALCGKCEKE